MNHIRNIIKKITFPIHIQEFFLFLMFVCLIAFRDKSALRNGTQVINILVQFGYMLKSGRLKWPKELKKYAVWGLLFSFYSLASYLWAKPKTTVISCFIAIVQVILVGVSILLYIRQDRKRYENVVNMLSIAALILCLRLVASVPFSAWGSERIARFVGYSNVQITYAISYIAVLAFAKAFRTKNKTFIVISIVLVAFSFLSGSKKAIIVAGLSMAMILMFNSKNPAKILRNTLIAVVLLIAGLLILKRVPAFRDSIWVRVEAMLGQLAGTALDKSTRDRALLIEYAFGVFRQHPILGAGLDAFRYNNPIGRYAHNNFMELLSCLGLIGFTLYYSIFAVFLRKTGIDAFRRKRREYLEFFTVFLCILVMDFTSVSYSLEPVQVIIAAAWGGYFAFKKSSPVYILRASNNGGKKWTW